MCDSWSRLTWSRSAVAPCTRLSRSGCAAVPAVPGSRSWIRAHGFWALPSCCVGTGRGCRRGRGVATQPRRRWGGCVSALPVLSGGPGPAARPGAYRGRQESVQPLLQLVAARRQGFQRLLLLRWRTRSPTAETAGAG